MGIIWSQSDATVRELAVGIMGLAAQAEALAEEAAAAYVFMLPDKIANILLKRPPMRSADLVQLIRASVEREGYDDFATLADDFDRLEQVRNDLAHAELAWADSPREDPDHHRGGGSSATEGARFRCHRRS